MYMTMFWLTLSTPLCLLMAMRFGVHGFRFLERLIHLTEGPTHTTTPTKYWLQILLLLEALLLYSFQLERQEQQVLVLELTAPVLI